MDKANDVRVRYTLTRDRGPEKACLSPSKSLPVTKEIPKIKKADPKIKNAKQTPDARWNHGKEVCAAG